MIHGNFSTWVTDLYLNFNTARRLPRNFKCCNERKKQQPNQLRALDDSLRLIEKSLNPRTDIKINSLRDLEAACDNFDRIEVDYATGLTGGRGKIFRLRITYRFRLRRNRESSDHPISHVSC